MSGPGARGASAGRGTAWRRLALSLAAVVLAAGCDNIVKAVPYFATMTKQPSVETFEQQPKAPPAGAVAADATWHLGLLQADSLARNPLTGTPAEVARGKQLFENFCLPCHGADGTGSGPVINKDGKNPRRIPYIPAVNLATGPATARSDGYLWGMISNGRGLMPSYDRIPADQRWYVVEYVRRLQKVAADSAASGSASGTR
ncbi:MAG: cytochrome c [Candidatus Palauibacterales bacterium]|nr:cytochrome c [Candidatus Palauibacterales bacterium]MDP2529214.1 cytochrome c [Candidatus Palauibacterales bacterium]MDP2583667.1 cytochrome c [Candidatus Palauibacterales bacterium]